MEKEPDVGPARTEDVVTKGALSEEQIHDAIRIAAAIAIELPVEVGSTQYASLR